MTSLRRLTPVFAALSFILSVPFGSSASPKGFKTIDVPVLGAISTVANGINDRGDIVGEYQDSVGSFHGFLLSHGTFVYINVPSANFTEALGINNEGEIVGDYTVPATSGTHAPPVRHGFLLSHGVFTTIDPPGSDFTVAFGINEHGEIAGFWDGVTGGGAFLLSHGTYTNISVPVEVGVGTQARGISSRGSIIGTYVVETAGLVVHGFLFSHGTFVSIDVLAAGPTQPAGINSRGDVVGSYSDAAHGFLLREGTFFPINVPGAEITGAQGINTQGDIVGSYSDSHGEHGFLLGKECWADEKDTELSDQQ
jgi:uncharacterized membrane protein